MKANRSTGQMIALLTIVGLVGCAHRQKTEKRKDAPAAGGRTGPPCRVTTAQRSSLCGPEAGENCPVVRELSFRCGPMPGAPTLVVGPRQAHLAFLLGSERMAYVALAPDKRPAPSYLVAPWQGRVGLAVSAEGVVHLFRGGRHWQRQSSAPGDRWRDERVLPPRPGGAEVYLLGAGLDERGEPYLVSAGPRLPPTLFRRRAGDWAAAHAGGTGYEGVARLDARGRLWYASWVFSDQAYRLSLQRIPGPGPALGSGDRYANGGVLGLALLPGEQDLAVVLAAYAEPDPSMASPRDQHRPPGSAKKAGLHLFLPRAQAFDTLRFPRTGGFFRSCSRDGRCIARTDRLLTAGITVTSDGVLWLAYVQEQTTTRSHRAFRQSRQMPYDKIDATQRHEELRLVRIDSASSPPAAELRWRVPDSGLLQNITRGGLALAFSGSRLHLAAGSRIAGRGAIRYVVIDTSRLPRLSFPQGERPQRSL